jgi:HAD superfamily hydrolase (TIGR01458 family)
MSDLTRGPVGDCPAGLLLDLDGVFFVGDDAVPGGAETVAWAEATGLRYLFVTNTTSHPRSTLVDKLARFGIRTTKDRILTPAVAAREMLGRTVTGPVALHVPDATREEFAGLPVLEPTATAPVSAVVVGDLGRQWDFARLNAAFRQLSARPAPLLVALGMTRFWQGTEGPNLDVGPFVAALEFATGVAAVVTGKPAPAFFEAAAVRLGVPAQQLAMVGDDIRGDVEGAQRAGIRGVLVRTGKYRPSDDDLGIEPDATLDSVADLPAWWEGQL